MVTLHSLGLLWGLDKIIQVKSLSQMLVANGNYLSCCIIIIIIIVIIINNNSII